MNTLAVIQALTALAALAGQLTPLVLELKTAIEAGDDASVAALLTKLQAVNDQLAAVP